MVTPSAPPIRVLKVCAIDSTAWLLLKTQMDAMRTLGWDVGVACTEGPYWPQLQEAGFATFDVPIARSTNVWSHLIATWRLYRLLRRERFDAVHVHTPVASLVGRLAARLAGVPLVLYTAHGFYFHDEMPRARRARHVGLERLFGRLTDHLFTQSAEDAATAVAEGIMPDGAVTAIGNGVILERFAGDHSAAVAAWRERLGIPPGALVVGIVGRVVEEKGYREYFQAAAELLKHHPNVAFLVVGSTLTGDRDSFQAEMATLLTNPVLKAATFFTGFTEEIPALMNAMDVFVLPSYREGMPRSIIEAMAAGKPVVATNIRGCREEVVEGETGYLVPTHDAVALAERIDRLVSDAALRERLGAAGRRRAEAMFHEDHVVARLLDRMKSLLAERGLAVTTAEPVRELV